MLKDDWKGMGLIQDRRKGYVTESASAKGRTRTHDWITHHVQRNDSMWGGTSIENIDFDKTCEGCFCWSPMTENFYWKRFFPVKKKPAHVEKRHEQLISVYRGRTSHAEKREQDCWSCLCTFLHYCLRIPDNVRSGWACREKRKNQVGYIRNQDHTSHQQPMGY